MINSPKFNHEKAYLIGLLVGGGKISENTFLINLPYNKWGMNPTNMNLIAVDILTAICDKFLKNYGFSVSYEIQNKKWIIKPIGKIDLALLTADLSFLGLPTEKELINNANLSVIKSKLVGIQVEHFLSGIFDTRASLTESHRRFNDDAPIVSVEIPGSSKNFRFVIQLCSWLTELGTITDQILYNHPCQHSPSDSDYKGWKKGFKIRFLAKSFLTQNSFAMKAKSFGVTKLKKQQTKQEQLPCRKRKSKLTPVSIHNDIDSSDLPIEVRNKLFFHYHHICAVMGCPFAPIEEIQKQIKNHKNLVSVFPKLSKGTIGEITEKYNQIKTKYFALSQEITAQYSVLQLLDSHFNAEYSELENGLAYLFSPHLNGKRHIGSKDKIIKNAENKNLTISFPQDIEGMPIMIGNTSNDRAIIVSSIQSKFNQQIVRQIVEFDGLEVKIK